MTTLDGYASLLTAVKVRVRHGQVRAALAANRELLHLYWDIGRLIASRQSAEGWGAGVIPRLARDLAEGLPGSAGFSERNLKRMVRFFQEYRGLGALAGFVPQPAAQMGAVPDAPRPSTAALANEDAWRDEMWSLPWGHHFLLIERVSDRAVRGWYAAEAVRQGWSRVTLATMLKSEAHARQGGAVTNFAKSLPEAQSTSLPTIDVIEAELASDVVRPAEEDDKEDDAGGGST